MNYSYSLKYPNRFQQSNYGCFTLSNMTKFSLAMHSCVTLFCSYLHPVGFLGANIHLYPVIFLHTSQKAVPDQQITEIYRVIVH